MEREEEIKCYLGNIQNINNSKYQIFIICSCEGLFGNILSLFLCPQCFLCEGKEVEYFKECESGTGKIMGGQLIHVLLVFISFSDSFHLSLGPHSG